MSAEPIHTLDDLATWNAAGPALAVVGHPIAHSLSPAIHNAALRAMAATDPRFATWRYFKFDLPPEALPGALPLFHARGFRGLNLTVPHKSIVIPQLIDRDEFVQAAGAANTLIRVEGGWRGANTDGYGLTHALHEHFGRGFRGQPVILLGAGGAARGAAVECLRAGCSALWVGNRTASSLHQMLAELAAHRGGAVLQGFDPNHPPAELPDAAIVINATSLGLKPDDPAPIALRHLASVQLVFDMIYRPATTALLRAAAELDIPHANGLAMLVHQGARSLAMWTDAAVPIAAMKTAAKTALHEAA